jgi:hypothetical protein
MRFAAYVGIKYSTLASWIQKREGRGQQEKSLRRADSGLHSDKGNGTWVEAVIERGPEPKAPQGSLRTYFNGAAYCQITNTRDAGLAAELLGYLGSVSYNLTLSLAAPSSELRSERSLNR